VVPLDELLASLDLREVGEDRYEATSADGGWGRVFGGQLLAQSVAAALTGMDDRSVRTLHTVFTRAARTDVPLEVHVDRMHVGRSVASTTVTFVQDGRPCARSMVLLAVDEPDLIRHADPAPDVGPPAPGTAPDGPGSAWQVEVVGGVDLADPDVVGPPELDVWVRFPGAPADAATDQALLAFATDAFLIGTAMRPHRGVGQAQAHRSISTGVISHTLTLHEPHEAKEWALLSHHATCAGRGRCHGRANVFAPDGTLVASFVQDGMIRAMDPAAGTGAL